MTSWLEGSKGLWEYTPELTPAAVLDLETPRKLDEVMGDYMLLASHDDVKEPSQAVEGKTEKTNTVAVPGGEADKTITRVQQRLRAVLALVDLAGIRDLARKWRVAISRVLSPLTAGLCTCPSSRWLHSFPSLCCARTVRPARAVRSPSRPPARLSLLSCLEGVHPSGTDLHHHQSRSLQRSLDRRPTHQPRLRLSPTYTSSSKLCPPSRPSPSSRSSTGPPSAKMKRNGS